MFFPNARLAAWQVERMINGMHYELRLNKGYGPKIYWFRLVLFQEFLETEISSHKQ